MGPARQTLGVRVSRDQPCPRSSAGLCNARGCRSIHARPAGGVPRGVPWCAAVPTRGWETGRHTAAKTPVSAPGVGGQRLGSWRPWDASSFHEGCNATLPVKLAQSRAFFFFFPLFFFLLLNSWNPLCKGNLTVKLKTDKRIFFSPSQLVGATDKGPWIWKHLKSRVSETLTHNAYMKGWYDILQSPAESFLIYTKGGLRRSS